MKDKSRHYFNNGPFGPGFCDINQFLNGINEIKNDPNNLCEQRASITHFGATSHYVTALAACADWPSLKTLEVICQNNPRIQDIDNAVPTLIAVLRSNPQLETLYLSHLTFSFNHEIEELFSVIQMHPGLKNIHLEGNAFADEATQEACLVSLAEMKNLDSTSCRFAWHGHAGLSQLIRRNPSIESLDFIPHQYAEHLVNDLTAHPESALKNIVFDSAGEHGVTILGKTVLSLIHLLDERHAGCFSIRNTYECGVVFRDWQQANEVLDMAQLRLACVIDLTIASIGDENRYTAEGFANPTILLFQNLLHALRNRNMAIDRAYLDQSDDTLTEMVYLHHQRKYEETFKVPAKEVFPVSLQVKTWFQLFKHSPELLPLGDDTKMKHANDLILKDMRLYNL